MDDKEFGQTADTALASIEHALEHCGADVDFELAAGGVLEIEFDDGSKIIVNRHGVAKEIWVAARSGGFHFRYDGSVWRDTRDGAELFTRLSALVGEQAGAPVSLGSA
jgi:CyaY protein